MGASSDAMNFLGEAGQLTRQFITKAQGELLDLGIQVGFGFIYSLQCKSQYESNVQLHYVDFIVESNEFWLTVNSGLYLINCHCGWKLSGNKTP
jgi:hypothetical protein